MSEVNRLRTRTIEKRAALSGMVLREIRKLPEMAAEGDMVWLNSAKKISSHFKVPQADSDMLLHSKRTQFPDVLLNLMPISSNEHPRYIPGTHTIHTYNEPWAFMHEYSHAGNRANILKKLRRILPFKTKIPEDEYILINNYLEDTYIAGSERARDLGRYIQNLIGQARGMKEKDTWRFLEELRANAQSYHDTRNITNPKNAFKVVQPSAINDIYHTALFRQGIQERRV